MTQTENITRDGQAAVKVTCSCASHAGHGNAAVIKGQAAAGIAALKPAQRAERIHGFVLLANHPAPTMRARNARKGIYAA